MSQQKITPCLWFDRNAEEAVAHYVSLLPSSRITSTTRWSGDGPGVQGTVMAISFELAGQAFLALNGGPQFHFTPAISLIVDCGTQAEIDALWDGLCASGAPGQCGWLTDKFGVSWQIVPSLISNVIQGDDAAAKARLFRAFMPMTKLDIGTLQRALEAKEETH
jgi:predicted 3-demethylubiquinone-9 3-methyltransferase (glyoxalase superfamily)